MKALTLTQPWASLVAIGAKSIETRSWRTPYCGLVAIHAAKAFPRAARELVIRPPYWEPLVSHGYTAYELVPLGAVVAVARLVDCLPIVEGNCIRRRPPSTYPPRSAEHRGWVTEAVPPAEVPFGNFAAGRYAWFLEDVRCLPEPIPARGALGLWEWEAPLDVLTLAQEVLRG